MHSIFILCTLALVSISYAQEAGQLTSQQEVNEEETIHQVGSNEEKPKVDSDEKTNPETGETNDNNALVIDCNCGETGEQASNTVIRAKRQCGYGYGYGCCCGPTGAPVTGMPCGCCGGCWGR